MLETTDRIPVRTVVGIGRIHATGIEVEVKAIRPTHTTRPVVAVAPLIVPAPIGVVPVARDEKMSARLLTHHRNGEQDSRKPGDIPRQKKLTRETLN